jgi:hypothetical protein
VAVREREEAENKAIVKLVFVPWAATMQTRWDFCFN